MATAYLLMQQAAAHTVSPEAPPVATPVAPATPLTAGPHIMNGSFPMPPMQLYTTPPRCDWCDKPMLYVDTTSAVHLRALANMTLSMTQQLGEVDMPVLCPDCAPHIRTIVRIARTLMLHSCGRGVQR